MTTRSPLHRPAVLWRSTRRHAATVAALCAAAAFAAVASGAGTFTVAAYVAVSVPSFLFAGALVLQRARPGSGPWRRMDRARPARGDGTALPWLFVIALLVVVELVSYLHGGPRADYPTISYGLNGLFRFRPAKAAVWFLWLVVGWFLARR